MRNYRIKDIIIETEYAYDYYVDGCVSKSANQLD